MKHPFQVVFIPAGLALSALPAQTHAQDSAEGVIEEVVVSSTRNRRSFAEQPTRVEVLGGEEINEKANMKPGDIRTLLNESTGIYVQQTSPTSFNSSIRIQGLDGKYTQILRDGMPLFGGFSGSLSLLQIAPLDLQRVELIKGANSTLYGGGAISGLVNLISKTPGAEPEASLLLNATSARGLDASAFLSGWQGSYGGTLFTSYNRSGGYDPADNGLSAIPAFERWTLAPRLFLECANTDISFGFSAVAEDRLGGDMDYVRGNKVPGLFFEDSETRRLTTQFELKHLLASGNEFVLRNSISHFERELLVPGWRFAGTQLSSFSEAHMLGTTKGIDWVAGLNLWTEEFDHDTPAGGYRHDFRSHTVGGFTQTTLSLSDQLSLEAGLRLDYHSQYGTFLLPRFSFLYTLPWEATLRFGGGMGYKTPTLFTDAAESLQYRDLRPLDASHFDAEESTGVNVDVNRAFEFAGGSTLNLNLLLFHTQVDDPLRLVALDDGSSAFSQPALHLDASGVEVNTIWNRDNLKLVLGYTHTDVQEHRAGNLIDYPLVPEDRLNTVLVYEREDDLRIGLEAYYYGPQQLVDGSKSRDYWMFGLMLEKYIQPETSLFLNFENFTDTRQTRFEPIYTGTVANPQFGDIYAPLDGFVINGGIKLKFQ